MSKNRGYIIPIVVGGLGNQLFQYLYGYCLSKIFKKELLISKHLFFFYKKRSYQLDKLVDKIKYISFVRYFFIRFFIFKKNIFNKEKEINYFKLKDNLNNNYNFYNDKNILLSGYWQSFKLIKQISDKDFKKIFPKLFQKNNILINNRSIRNNDIALHIRRGDFFSDEVKNIHGIVTLQYYKDSINYFRNKLSNNCNFFIFTDDTNFIKENFNNLEYDLIKSDDPTLDFIKLSYFKKYIISNSTYGLLSSYISFRRGNDVNIVSPKIWCGNTFTKDTELMFTNFKLIDN